MMETLELLKRLTAPGCVSGNETQIGALAAEMLGTVGAAVRRTPLGSVIGSIGTRAADKPHVLLDAHMDQVGFYVTHITDDGFVRVGNVGGLDYRLMPGQRVTLHGKEPLHGVIAGIPPHLLDDEEKVPQCSELWVDTGIDGGELKNLLRLGDSITYAMPLRQMQGELVSAPALDDRCCMAAILLAAQQVQQEELPCSVDIVFSTQEEVTGAGAQTAAYLCAPDYAVAVDVTFALGHGDDPVKCGRLGEGAMIGISPTLDRGLSDALVDIAQAEHIPFQIEVMSGRTGTNADQITTSRGGVRTVTVSIPLRYMHTPAEVISCRDVEHTAALLAAWLRRCGA